MRNILAKKKSNKIINLPLQSIMSAEYDANDDDNDDDDNNDDADDDDADDDDDDDDDDNACTEDWSCRFQWEAFRYANDEPLVNILDEI